MKRFVRHLLRFVMAVFLVHAAVQNAAAFRVLRSASELGYPPFALVTPGGFSVELLKAVAKQVDMGVAFGVGPWQSIKQELMDGKIDGLLLVSFSAGATGASMGKRI